MPTMSLLVNSYGHICDASAISTILRVFYTNHENYDTLREPERVLEKAIDWRAYHQRIIITDLDSFKFSIFLQAWIFVLQWSYAILHVSCLKNVATIP